ncbi:MAG TPA: lactonase family protein [Clostridiales bacterium]|nr:lactonase family protein [Clostridiales bacterium]
MSRWLLGTWNGQLIYHDETDELKKQVTQLTKGQDIAYMELDYEKMLLFVLLNNKDSVTGNGGSILTYQINGDGQGITFLNEMGSFGAYPIEIKLEDSYAVVVNHGSTKDFGLKTVRDNKGKIQVEKIYEESSIVLFGRKKDGTLGEALDVIKFQGSGEIPFFQEAPSPHSLYYLHSKKEFYVPERGTDRVSVFQINEQDRHLKKIGIMKSKKGYGPRNITFHPSGKWAYLMHEIESYVFVYERAEKPDGRVRFKKIQEIKTVTEEVAGAFTMPQHSFAALHPVDLAASDKGQYLYVLTRSSNTLTTFHINQKTGRIKIADCSSIGGINPRQISVVGEEIYIITLDDGSMVKWEHREGNMCPERKEVIIEGIPKLAVGRKM